MSNERQLKNRIKYILIIPVILALILLGFEIFVNGIGSKVGMVSLSMLVIYIIVVVIIYLRMLPAISRIMVDYSLEQGKIQKELIKELELPYAILDMSGHILWANNIFHDVVGISRNTRIRKTIDSYFSQLTPDIIGDGNDIETSIEYSDRQYRVSMKRVDMSKVFDENGVETKDDDIVLVVYLFDETELRRYKQETMDQKLYAGLIYLDNYDEVMDSLEDVKHSILTALIERKINMYLGNIDAIVKHIENDKYFFVFRQKFMQTLRDDRFSLLDEVKNINVGNDISMTLSIGIGADTDASHRKLYECL